MSPAPPTLPPIETLNTLPEPSFTSSLNLLFEPAPPLAQALYASRPYPSYSALLSKTHLLISSFPTPIRLEIINAHPAIGAPKTTLSALSYAEQGYTSTTQTTTEDPDAEVNAELRELNKQYEEKYGFRFVVFVNGRPRKDIVPVLRDRLENGTREGELETGLREMTDIAADRLRKLGQE
ncbi:hypothetical protein HDV00_011296 [Rhizophlyctis rosea]|nr:hypothetical protein HDV00_011296 [Rhizophlyctis rosea]